MSILKYPELSFESPEVIYKIQEDLLRKHLRHICDNSAYYRDKLKGIDAEHFPLSSLSELPLTDKSDFSEYNEQFQAVSDRSVADMSFSSGTTGQPTKFVYTQSDLDRLAYNEAQAFRSCGFTDEDVVLLTCTMDRCFIAGLAYYSGPKALGATMIRNGRSTLASHFHIIERIRPTALIGVPIFLLKLAQYITAQGFNLAEHSIKRMVCIGEPLRDRDLHFLKVGEELERLWGAKVYSTYAATETITAFCECEYQLGGHCSGDLGIIEIVDEDGNNVPNGEVGEVVVTPLQMEGMPMIRYRTGDISFIAGTSCPCGRNMPRLGPILGRRKQMMKIRGTSIYPQGVQAVLDELPQVKEYYLKVQNNESFSEHLTIYVALEGDQSQTNDILQVLQARLRVKPDLVVEPIEEIKKIVYNPESRKPIRFIDERK